MLNKCSFHELLVSFVEIHMRGHKDLDIITEYRIKLPQ